MKENEPIKKKKKKYLIVINLKNTGYKVMSSVTEYLNYKLFKEKENDWGIKFI